MAAPGWRWAKAVSDCPLTKRQLQVALLEMDGLTRKQVAARLGVAYSTVRNHMHDAYVATGVTGRGQLFALILQEGWGPPATVDYKPPSEARGRHDMNWRPTAAGRLYLDAFDTLLRRRDAASAEAMSLALDLMCWERGVRVPRIPFEAADVVERVDAMLLGIARGLARDVYGGPAA